jgi:hypothetical protein
VQRAWRWARRKRRWTAAWRAQMAHAAGADGLIVTVRTERDAEEALQLLAKLR